MTRTLLFVLALSAVLWTGTAAAQGVDASEHQHGAPPSSPPPAGVRKPDTPEAPATPADAAPHQHEPTPALPSFITPVTDADRRAAFPDVHGHAAHDNGVYSYILFDQMEWQRSGGTDGVAWDSRGWVGRDLDRLWFRTEGRGADGRVDDAEAHVLYGRAIARWWDVVAGVRQDVRPGSPQTWGAVGIQGLAPYWFQLAVTAYVGPSARTNVRVEAEYELLLTNRLILKPLVDVELRSQTDRDRGVGAGLSSADIGVRLRYEVRRELAPYVGIVWSRRFFGTADLARTRGAVVGEVRFVSGLRVWM